MPQLNEFSWVFNFFCMILFFFLFMFMIFYFRFSCINFNKVNSLFYYKTF